MLALSPSEHKVARLVMEGKTNREIASAAHLAYGSVRAYISRILEKWGLRNRTELAIAMLTIKQGEQQHDDRRSTNPAA